MAKPILAYTSKDRQKFLVIGKLSLGNPVRNSSGALNPAGIILKSNPAAEQRGIISNGVKVKKPVWSEVRGLG